MLPRFVAVLLLAVWPLWVHADPIPPVVDWTVPDDLPWQTPPSASPAHRYTVPTVGGDTDLVYHNPEFWDFMWRFPGDYVALWDKAMQEEAIPYWGAVVLSTGVLIYYDQKLINGAQNLGRRWGIGNKDNTKPYFSIFGQPIRGPSDVGSAMYFIGDGWLHSSFALGFLGYGYFGEDSRALRTGSELVEGLMTTAFATQTLKHITGRESPIRATQGGGVWRFFPNQIDYHQHVPSFDAFPSGHLATGVMTVTVIAENYPEYTFVQPLGWTLLGLLSFQMMNNGVHWASDYPLAIAMGYGFGKVAVARGRAIEAHSANRAAGIRRDAPQGWDALRLAPMVTADGSMGIGVEYPF
ncbi:MAG: hypothetical protein COX57_09405 [Alphaproteobacteria bacterium CG_4_10_14_0_2_um_filter_63_37]|nr:MAG: hypothetical protein AUJ55_02260 [Proteobacteria bacterium CG1_02_64_396]PJA24279.1 MAG: hypothetical protein COX57_09405 [Alphaproteobacteria bacterium CG_4_10_14_0_2_um_filter_63_37]